MAVAEAGTPKRLLQPGCGLPESRMLPLLLDLLSKTFSELIARHPALSMTVRETDEGPIHEFKNPVDWLQL